MQKNMYVVSLGVGSKDHLTHRAMQVLEQVDIIYVMAQEKSWMVRFVQEIAPQAFIRVYFPSSVAWAEWHDDPILDEITTEAIARTNDGKRIAFALAGDCSIYGNFSPLEQPLRDKGATWEMVPGVSFLNALPIELKTVLVSEGENLLLTRISNAAELDNYSKNTSVIVLYNPNNIIGFPQFIQNCDLIYAKCVAIGVEGKMGKVIDLIENPNAKLVGLVIIKFKT